MLRVTLKWRHERSSLCCNNITFPLFSLILCPQTCSLSPVRPSSTPPRHSSAKKSSTGDVSKADNGICVSHLSSPSGCSPRKNKKERKQSVTGVPLDCSYQQPTVSSRTRALSPYTHRKMCQLSEDARQRLSHLQLGPHHFRRETESQPPFLVCNISYIPPL